MAENKSIGVPSVKGMKSAFGDYAVGAIGGLVYALSRGLLGNGLLGSLVAPILAGTVVKGERGTALATVAGFLQFSGATASQPSQDASANTQEEYM